MVMLAASALRAGEASEAEIARRNRLCREAAECEAERNALKERIRADREAAWTLGVTAELMEGVRESPPVERERLVDLHRFESGTERVVTKAAADKANCVHRWLTLQEGRRYRFRAEAKAEDVRDASVKFGLMVSVPWQKTQWPDCKVGSGTFDWRGISFDYEVPAGAGSVLLFYGLESGSGRVSFRNVVVSEISRVLE